MSKMGRRLDAQLLEGFVKACLLKTFDKPAEIPACHREWWELCTSENNYVAIAAPRGHAKSTAITHSYTLASVLFREHKFVIIVSDTESQASLFLQDIVKELAENEDIIKLFGVKRFAKLTETNIIVEMDDGWRFRIIAKGAEQKMRGIKWDNRRPDLIVCDDLENDEIVLNEERREKFRRWFYGALMPCLGDGGQIRLVGTILHLDSLLENLMPVLFGKHTVDLPLKSFSINKKGHWKSVRYRAHNPDFTQILWPEKFPKQRLREIREEYVDKGMPDVYSQEYLNFPLDQSLAYFKEDDFIPMTDADRQDIEEKRKILNYYIGTDLAISEKERADYSVFVVVGMDEEGMLYVTDVVRERLDARGIVDKIIKLHRIYKPALIAIEEEKIKQAIGPFLRESMLAEHAYPIIEGFRPSVDKQMRAKSIQGRMRVGRIKFDKKADWYFAFESELRNFPKDKHDDQVDAFAYIGLALDKFVTANTRREQELEDYDLEKELFMTTVDDYQLGKSLVTGY